MVREQRENGKQAIAYHARPFVLCGLPLRRPPPGEIVHRRQNGKFFLEVVVHPRFGLPFGQDRLIPIWIATLAVKQKSRTVHFKRAAQLLEFLQLPKDGIHYRRLIQGFERIFAASMFFGTDQERSGGQESTGRVFIFLIGCNCGSTMPSRRTLHRPTMPKM
jgi:hypothetical protein